jgi:hypothetical protein
MIVHALMIEHGLLLFQSKVQKNLVGKIGTN